MKKLYSFKYALLLAYLLINCFIGQAAEHSGSLEFSKILKLNLPQQLLKKVGSLSENSRNTSSKIKQSENSGGLVFVKNEGQIIDNQGNKRPEILFSTTNNGVSVFIEKGCLNYVFTKVDKTEGEQTLKEKLFSTDKPKKQLVTAYRFRVNLIGANPNAEVITDERQDYYEMHYTGGHPNGLKAESYKKITIKDAYPGVDWLIYSNGEGMKYDFVVNNHENLSKIKLEVDGAESFIDKEGRLIMNTPLGKIIEESPKTYQDGNLLQSNFKLNKGEISFNVSGAISNKPIIIDPTIMWSTYYASHSSLSEQTYGLSCVVDQNNNIISTGFTNSVNFPALNGIQMNLISDYDVIIMKYTQNGNKTWATFYGGFDNDYGYSCSLDDSSNIYLTGATESSGFPTVNASQNNHSGMLDAFILKLTPAGLRRWCTFFGGSEREIGNSISASRNGTVAIVGYTISTNLPLLNPIQSLRSVGEDGYVAYFNRNGIRQFSTYYGGNGYDAIKSCNFDASGNLYFTGITGSNNLPTLSPYQNAFRGGTFDAFIGKLSNNGVLTWATYFGGNDFDFGYSCNTDKNGNLYVTGHSMSNNFPLLSASQPFKAGGLDAYASKFNSNGVLQWSTFFGGNDEEIIFGSALDSSDNFFIAGRTASLNLPLFNPLQDSLSVGSGTDAFLAYFNNNGLRRWSTYLGGNGNEVDWSTTVVSGIACAIDKKGALIITGNTSSSNFPVVNGISSSLRNNTNGFLLKILSCFEPTPPQINSFGATTFCIGDSVKLEGPANVKRIWSTGDTSSSIWVKTSGSYSLRSYNGTCTSANGNVIAVEVKPTPSIPTIISSGDTTFCEGDSIFLTGPPNVNYFWSNNATTQSIIVKNTGKFTLQTFLNGCSSPISQILGVRKITAPPAALIFPWGPTNFCQGDSVSLAAAPGFKYIWSNGDTTQTIIVKNAGDYSVRIINEKCFSDPSPVLSVTVNPIPQPLGIVAGGPTFFCLGDSVILTADSSQGYIWSNGATTRSISVKRGGDYSVQAVVNGCISPASQTVNVTVTPPEQPEIVASGPVNICAGDSVVLSAPSGFMYLWSNNAVSETITVKSSGTFTVSTIASGCTSTVSNPVTVNVTPIPNPVSISAGGPTGFCLGDSVILTAGPSSGYLWSNGATTQSIAVKRGGLYTVRAVNNNCFSDSSNSIRVMVSPPEVPEITPLGATDFCSGDSVFLTAPAGLEYIWSTNEITQTIKVKSSGFYTVRTILNNCTSTVSQPLQINVVQMPNQPTITADGPVSFCQGESVKLNASPGTAHLWSTGETGAFIEVNQPGKYYVQTLNGFCVSPKSDSIIVIVRDTSRTITGANVCQGTVIPFGNTLITSSGIYTQVLTNAFGCDSTIVFDALVHPKPSTAIRFLSNGSVRAVAQGPQYSYIWINNMGSIISTTDSLNRPSPAFYTLIVIDSTFGLGCADTTTFFVRSINKSLTSSLKVYPNPADNLIKVEGLPEDSQLYFYTPLGVKIPAEINLEGQINTRDLPAGVYFLVINSRTETQTIKVSIKH